MQVLMVLQARVSSTRLPSKVLKPILGKPMLAHQILRLKKVKLVDKIVVATSVQRDDDDIEKLCNKLKIECYRGKLDDVLDRYYQACLAYKPTHVVRVTGDCPLIDSDIIDQVIKLHLDNNYDYSSNCAPPTLPDGLDVEIFTFSALEKAWLTSKLPSEREHVTLFIRNNPDLFSMQNFSYHNDLSTLRWTVDEAADFEFVTQIYEALYPKNKYFNLRDILTLLQERPNLSTINQHFNRNEGLIKSLMKDKELSHD